MTVTLHAFQDDLVNAKLRPALAKHRAVLLQSACRSGKTIMASAVIESAAAKRRVIYFVVHRDLLLRQTSNTLKSFGIAHTHIAAGKHTNRLMQVYLCSIQTLVNRLGRAPSPDLIIIDECHRTPSASYDTVLKFYPKAKVVGLSASPWRTSGKGLGSHYQDMVIGPSVRWLIDNGFLAEYKAYAPARPDIGGVHRSKGDYVQSELEAVLDQGQIVFDTVGWYQKLAPGLKTLCFAVSVKHSKHLAAAFVDAGISAVHMDADTPSDERVRFAKLMALGKISVITSVNLLGEGVDLASLAGMPVSIECVILCRPTESVTMHIQQVTRSMTPSPGKEFGIIMDLAGNLAKHGLPDQEHEWSLADREARPNGESEKVPLVSTCKGCFAGYPAFKAACPYCGLEKEIKSRKVEEVAVDVVEVSRQAKLAEKAAASVEFKRERQRARTVPDLIAFARKRGMANPVAYAAMVVTAREAAARKRTEHQVEFYLGR